MSNRLRRSRAGMTTLMKRTSQNTMWYSSPKLMTRKSLNSLTLMKSSELNKMNKMNRKRRKRRKKRLLRKPQRTYQKPCLK